MVFTQIECMDRPVGWGGSGGSDEPPPHLVPRSAQEEPTANLWGKWLSLWSDVSGDSLET